MMKYEMRAKMTTQKFSSFVSCVILYKKKCISKDLNEWLREEKKLCGKIKKSAFRKNILRRKINVELIKGNE